MNISCRIANANTQCGRITNPPERGQPYKYNGKELDKMHGLNTYDYGARQYNPVTARWDRETTSRAYFRNKNNQ